MNLLFYSPVHLRSGGGCERWHCDVTASLKAIYGHSVKIITGNLGSPQWSDAYLANQLQVPYETINFPLLFGALIPTPGPFLKLLGNLRGVDVVHVINGFIGQDILFLLLKWLTGKKVILGWHAPIFHHITVHNLYIKYVTRWLLNFFDGHMTLNASDKKFLEEQWNIKNVHFIPSGVRVERFLAQSRHSHDKLNFITVGIYRPQKGIDLSLENDGIGPE